MRLNFRFYDGVEFIQNKISQIPYLHSAKARLIAAIALGCLGCYAICQWCSRRPMGSQLGKKSDEKMQQSSGQALPSHLLPQSQKEKDANTSHLPKEEKSKEPSVTSSQEAIAAPKTFQTAASAASVKIAQVQFPDKKTLLAKLGNSEEIDKDSKEEIAEYLAEASFSSEQLPQMFAQLAKDLELDGALLERVLRPLGKEAFEELKTFSLPSILDEVKSAQNELKEKKALTADQKQGAERGGETKETVQAANLLVSQQELRDLMSAVEEDLKSLIAQQRFSSEERPFYSFSIEESLSESGMCCALKANNLVMGYSFFLLLKNLNIASTQYDYIEHGTIDSQTFKLKLEDLRKLTTFLKQARQSMRDAAAFFDSLLEQPGYVEVGKKRISEFLQDKMNLSTSTLNVLSDLCQKAENQHKPAPHSLFFGLFGINLEGHSQKEFYKGLFESWFADWNMKGGNDKPKTFQFDDPYRANINLVQLNQLCRSMTDLIDLRKETNRSITTQAEYLDALKTLLRQKLDDFAAKACISLWPTHTLTQASSVAEAKRAYTDMYKKTIEAEVRGIFCLAAKDLRLEPSPELISSAYSGFISLFSNNKIYRNRQGQRLANIPYLLDQLQAKHQSQSTALSQFKEKVISYLDQYPALQMDEAALKNIKQYDRTIELLEKGLVILLNSSEFSLQSEQIEDALSALCVNKSAGSTLEDIEQTTKNLLIAFDKWGLEEFLEEYKQESLLKAATHSGASIDDQNQFSSMIHVKNSKARFSYWNRSREALAAAFMSLYKSSEISVKVHHYFSDLFWQLNERGNDEKLCRLLDYLGFEAQETNKAKRRAAIEQKYRNGEESSSLEGVWKYAKFERDLSLYIVPFLIRERVLFMRSGVGSVLSPTLDVNAPTHSCEGSNVNPGNDELLSNRAGSRTAQKMAESTQTTSS